MQTVSTYPTQRGLRFSVFAKKYISQLKIIFLGDIREWFFPADQILAFPGLQFRRLLLQSNRMIFNARLAPYRASPNVSGIADLIAAIPTHIATLKKKKREEWPIFLLLTE